LNLLPPGRHTSPRTTRSLALGKTMYQAGGRSDKAIEIGAATPLRALPTSSMPDRQSKVKLCQQPKLARTYHAAMGRRLRSSTMDAA
jgi:hypothetical protein